ncbi:hypothetical protein EV188_103752 [Actinomycetospora succinea]|uniref:DUF4352 domain-containing protein n=1 Tax=Actinomycetospora succinea TaxID=663603 RepID=A0A4R6VPA2_9PSEU|nr:hypothetical protein [Actinomycetospora succinea]TDQ61245.1 hypothetical protein EV188_103752 [Actinomycetospora succinea]
MTVVQPPRHRAPSGAQGFGHEPHPSGPITVTPRPSRRAAEASVVDAPTTPIPRAALDAARMRPATMAPQAPMVPAGPMVPMPAPRNGLGITGLVLGLCGLVVGMIPLLGFGAILLGLVGLVLGLVGVTRARKRVATNIRTAVAGVIACVLAIALGITGLVIVANAVTQLNEDLSSIGAGTPPASAPAPATSAVAFGQTFTYADGLAVTVSEPTSYDPSSYAAGNTNPYAYSVTIRVTNNTGAAFDPVLLHAAMSTGGAPASQIFDAETGTPPQNQLQPGRSLTYELAFSTAANTGEAQVDVTPSFSHDPAVFTGNL